MTNLFLKEIYVVLFFVCFWIVESLFAKKKIHYVAVSYHQWPICYIFYDVLGNMHMFLDHFKTILLSL